VGLGVGANYVRFIEIDPTLGTTRERGSWAGSGSWNNVVIGDLSRSCIERKSIDSRSCVSGEATVYAATANTANVEHPDSSTGCVRGIAFPVADASGVLGAIGIYFENELPAEHDLDFVGSLAAMLAMALRARRRSESLSSDSMNGHVYAEILRLISKYPRLDDAYDQVADIIKTTLEFDALTITLIDPVEQTRRIEFATGAALPSDWTLAPRSLSGSMDNEIVISKNGLRVGEENRQSYSTNYRDAADLSITGFKSWLTVPLRGQDREIGLLSVLSKRKETYDDGDLEILGQVGGIISGALANLDLHRQLDRDTETRMMLAELDRAVKSCVRISEVYPLFADNLKHWIPFDRLAISAFHPSRGTVTKSYVHGSGVPGWHAGRNYPPGPLTEMAIRVGHGVIRDRGEIYPDESASPYEDKATSAGLLSALAVPLVVDNRTVGTLCLRASKRHAFDSRDMELAEFAGVLIAGSILGYQYQSSLDAQKRETETLDRFFSDIASAKSMDEILDSSFETIAEFLQIDRMVLGLITPGATPRMQLYARGDAVPGDSVTGRLAFSAHDADGWVRDGYLLPYYGMVTDVPLLDSDHSQHLVDAGLTSWMHVPLATDQLLGYLAVQGRPRAGYSDLHQVKLDKIAYLLAQILQTVTLPSQHTEPSPESSDDVGDPVGEAGIDPIHGSSLHRESTPIDLLLINGDPLYLAGLSTIINRSNINLVGVTNWADAHSEITAMSPDAAMIYAHGDDAGLSFMHSELNSDLMPPMLVILEDSKSGEALHYIEAGASEIISLDAPAHQIIGAIERVANRSRERDFASHTEQQPVPLAVNGHSVDLQKITHRDREIITGLASGLTNSEIATELNLAAGTVGNRLAELYAILDVPDRSAAVYKSMRLGIIK
jgi:DNA-binding NarL/FixJ family response regulator/GAF domain-containing protein